VQFPAQLEIAYPDRPVQGVVRPPGSKSITNRALVVAALARGVSKLHDPLEADDTLVMRRGLTALGAAIDDVDDPWLVLGTAGALQTPAGPIDAGESGTTARFLTALGLLAPGGLTVIGWGRMAERPMDELVAALRNIGAVVDAAGTLPVTVRGPDRLAGGTWVIDPSRSSQFVSSLLMVAPLAEQKVTLVMDGSPVSRPYLASTAEVMRVFGAAVADDGDRFEIDPGGYRGSEIFIEADASAAVYPMVAAAITGGTVRVEGIPAGSLQPDLGVVYALETMGCLVRRFPDAVEVTGPAGGLEAIDIDCNGFPDGAVALAAAALFAEGESRLRNIGNLRLKESDRLAALETELGRVGGEARIEGDDLVVTPGSLRAATVATYHDHRIAMSFALVGLRQPGIVIDNPACVTKTWPGYFDMLAGL
jgi:3-phosphoshikimate 1-carboxyvinyltransferase